MSRLLLDTDVLVEYLRGRDEAVAYLEGLEADLFVSTVTVAELFAGAREAEEPALRQLVAAFDAVAPDADVAEEAGRLRRRFAPSHGTGLADALIAATAQALGARLVTFNRRHFPMLEVTVPYPR